MTNLPATIQKNYWIEKRNLLNELHAGGLTLQELRIFSIYLAKINARDPATRKVRFSLTDFMAIMDLGRINRHYLINVIDSLYDKKIHVPRADHGFEAIHIFRKIMLARDENDAWFVEIDAHEDSLPYLFEFKGHYFKYQLWNALNLRSPNQIRVYEILKQYEYLGERTLPLKELRDLIGIGEDEYKKFSDFKERVLDACRKALTEYTDITFSYEISKKGRSGKVKELRFLIEKNLAYTQSIALQDLIGALPNPAGEDDGGCLEIPENERGDARYELELQRVAEVCQYRFSFLQVKHVRRLLRIYFHGALFSDKNPEKILQNSHYDYLEEKYNQVLCQSHRSVIGYLTYLLDLDLLYKYGPKGLIGEPFGHRAGKKAMDAYLRETAESN